MNNSTKHIQSNRTDIISVGSVILGNTVIYGSSQATAILLGLYISYINLHITPISAIQVGLIGTGYRVVEFIFDPIMGGLSDRLGRKFFLIIGPICNLVAVLLYPSFTSLWVIFFLLFLEGLGAAMRSPVGISFLTDATSGSEKMRGRTMGVYQLSSLTSLVLGYALGGKIWDWAGTSGFRLLAPVYIIGILIILFGTKDQKHISTDRLQIGKKLLLIFKNRELTRILPAWLSLSAVLGAWMSQSVFQLVGQVRNNDQLLVGRFNGTQVGLILAIFSIIFASGTVAWGFLIGRITKIKIMFVSLLGAYLCCFALTVLNHTFLHLDGSPNWLFIIFLVILGIGVFAQSGFTPTALAFIGDISEGHERDRGTIIGFYYLFLSVGQMIGAWFGGIFAQFLQIDGVIILTIVLVTTGILNLFFISRRQMEENHAAPK